MFKNKNIICISSIDWDFVWQGHQEIMSTFAKNGNRVLFIENTGVRTPNFKDGQRLKKRIINWFKGTKGFRKEMENLFIYSPISLPFPYSKFASWINRRILIKPLKDWMRIIGFYNPIIWTFLPTRTALGIIDNIEKELLVYYCIADFSELVDNPKKVMKTEKEIIKKSDLVFVQGEVFKKRCIRLNNNVHIFPFGVRMKIFEDFKQNLHTHPSDMKDIERPIIGYVGGVHKHIDFSLLDYIARSHPDWSIVLVGPKQCDVSKLSSSENIFLLGKKDFLELPKYINGFDVCIIPYLKTEYTKTAYPTKLNEYHALGKPVVSTDLPEIINFNLRNGNLVSVAKTKEEFEKLIHKALNEETDNLISKRIVSATKNNWLNRLELMSNLIEKATEEKSMQQSDWRENLLRFYKAARRKTLSLAFAIFSIYLLIFYTPLIWLLAGPLKISQFPENADCIVVFGGGVGESGKAGQGYEERVQYAVDLFKKKYAKYLIFSSGYTYVFKEPEVMKALAISLGIPQGSIILEDNAKNTHENVKFTKEILDKRYWNKILLISSPYHMRRASLVFNRSAKDIKITYTPIPKSKFYMHGHELKELKGKKVWKQINLRQIKGLVHEYLGIVYYWWKGYI